MTKGRRVAVTSPQTRVAQQQRRQARPWRRPQLNIAQADRAAVVHRRQRAKAVTALGLLFALVIGLPVVFGLAPWLDGVRVGGVPLSWLLLGVLPYPAMLALALWQLARAERTEDDEPVDARDPARPQGRP